MKIVVDELPVTPNDCPFYDEFCWIHHWQETPDCETRGTCEHLVELKDVLIYELTGGE